MEQINWMRKPLLTNPVAIIAFEGWSDAANIASGCIEHLSCNYDVEPFAELNSENFYNFQMRRPVIEIQGIGDRRFHWPQTSFYAIENFSRDRDVVLVFGEEPAMKWKSYSDVISDALVELGINEAVTLGAFFGQVAHTLPVPVFGVSDDPTFHSRHDILSTDYSGPTGITSVVGQSLRDRDVDTSGLWAAVPHYLSSGGYPKGMSALLKKMSSILNIDIDDSGILAEGQQFETKITKAMENSDDLAEYVAKLEEAEFQLNDISEENLVEQIEDFLKGDESL